MVDVDHMAPSHPYCGDDGLLTFRSRGHTFTISLPALEAAGPIWYPEAGVLIADAGDPTDIRAYQARHQDDKTLAQRVAGRDEQSLAGALYGQPRPHPVSYSIGCPYARQRFWIEPNGDLVLHKRNVEWVPGRDTHRFKNRRNGRFYFGLERWFISARFPDPEPMLAYNIHARRDGLVLEQKCIAVPLTGPPFTTDHPGDEPMVASCDSGSQIVRARKPISDSPPATPKTPAARRAIAESGTTPTRP